MKQKLPGSADLLGMIVAGFAVLAFMFGSPGRAQERGAAVYVMIWFNTEDYILPESNDAAKRLAVFLSERDIRGTFKLVGEKARMLQKLGRQDVIAALGKHEIGYHTNFHSQHPTPSEYLEQMEWEEGIDEFDRRERSGFQLLRRMFGQKPTTYGQPGSSWAPHYYGALRRWGVGTYVDAFGQMGYKQKPFWYGGVLHIVHGSDAKVLRPNADFSNLEESKNKFFSLYERRLAEGGGVISQYYHPCEFIHAAFWDAVNFSKGANPPPAEWKIPSMLPPETSEAAFRHFEGLVEYMRTFPRVKFITASEALELYRDGAQRRVFSRKELAEIADQVDQEISFQEHPNYTVAPSEVFALMTSFLAGQVREKAGQPVTLSGTPFGPTKKAAALTAPLQVSWSQFFRTVLDVEEFLQKRKRVPSVVWFGSRAAPPAAYLRAAAEVAAGLLKGKDVPDIVEVRPARMTVGDEYVSENKPDLWDWPIFPEGFTAPHLMELGRLQAWTMKPAPLFFAARKR